ncbi:hypothetical protein [Microbacterium sp. ZXX196]|uniref:hypothetical protein n=1 Tax=Microbacterium sp. ZXX196 TaxID=2609291 RepID=UPI0012B793F1|nr:hypothetical protein [Microbacterium sp. ZXX196]MTE24624.1 hypothetical protein [Microbacterium sp. ZXX196]
MNDDDFPIPEWDEDSDVDVPGPIHPINWWLLTAEELQTEFYELNRFVDELRHERGLPVSVIPPFWHRHWELVRELSALHLHYLVCHDGEQSGSAPMGWERDFEDSCRRLRDKVAACGSRGDSDRPTRQAIWPGEEEPPHQIPVILDNRAKDFVAYVSSLVTERKQREEAFYASLDLRTGELA